MSLDNLDHIYRAYLTTSELLQDPLLPHDPAMSDVNDCAYFVLLFAQVEDVVTRYHEDLVGEEASFFSRLEFAADGAGVDFSLLADAYELRCDIAHGRVCSHAIAMPVMIRPIRQVMETLG